MSAPKSGKDKTFFRTPPVQAFLAFFVALAVIFAQAQKYKDTAPYADSVSYLAVAVPLHDRGVLTDGNYGGDAIGTGSHGEGMFFAPLYPAFLSVLMHISSGFNETAHCAVEKRKLDIIERNCRPLHLKFVVGTQIMLAAIAAALTWGAAFFLTGRAGLSWLAMILVLAAREYAHNAAIIMTENLVFPLFTAATLCFVAALKKKSFSLSAASGVALGLLALTRPSFSYLYYFAAAIMLPLALWWLVRRVNLRRAALMLLFLLCCVLSVAPWIVRNGTKIGVWDISAGYGAFTLVQRAAFNDMNATEWWGILLMSLPDFGDKLALKLFSYDNLKRLDLSNKDSFYQYGNHVLREREQTAAGGPAQFQPYLIKKYILAHPVKHLWVTLAMTWKGMWVGKNLAYLFIPAFFVYFVRSVRRRDWPFVLFSLGPWLLLGLNGFVSFNITRYNLILLPCLSVAAAWALLEMAGAARDKMRALMTGRGKRVSAQCP